MTDRSGLLREFEVVSPDTTEEVIQLLAELPSPVTFVSGATKLMTRLRRGVWIPEGYGIDLSRIPELRRIDVSDSYIRIGSCVSCEQIRASVHEGPEWECLREGADFGPPALQAQATIGGNVMSAGMNSDLVTALLSLDASAVLLSSEGTRPVPLFSLFIGRGRTAAKSSEVLVELQIPRDPNLIVARFERVRQRRAGHTTVSLAGAMLSDGVRPAFRVAVGGAGTNGMRLFELERLLAARPFDKALTAKAVKMLDSEITPPENHLGTAAYRRLLIGRLLERFLSEL